MKQFSIIVPVYNRPDEIDELLQSLTRQTFTNFEVIIVEDGSTHPCQLVCNQYKDLLDIKYFFKENSGPGFSRNYGVERAIGEYIIILDSDVVLPREYFNNVITELNSQTTDAFGGPDKAHSTFSDTQKAISYSMTAFFTTGGIRGGKKKLDKFYPRSYNMGIKRTVYQQLGGFSQMRFGEDIDFSIRILKAGYTSRLFPKAWVWHKRRTDFRKFFRQVFNSGIARINLYKKHSDSLKLVHLLPSVFTIGISLLAFMTILGILFLIFAPQTTCLYTAGRCLLATGLIFPSLYSLCIFVDASKQYKSMHIGLLSIRAAYTQLFGYGLGFLIAWFKRCVQGKEEFFAFGRTFYL